MPASKRFSTRSTRSVAKDEDTCKLITTAELETREKEYVNLLDDVSILKNICDESRKNFDNDTKKKIKTNRWLQYVNCDGLPDVHKPEDIRKFLAKLQHFEDIHIDGTPNWTLSINDRSILTHDMRQKDLTRQKLIKELRPNLGEYYDRKINLFLRAIESIDHVLDNEIELSALELSCAQDIVMLRSTIENEIQMAFDRFTYRIVSAADTYMSTCEGIEANYCYNGQNFNFHIWSLRDVPIRFEQLENPLMIANLPCVGVQIQIPFSCLSHKLTLRCVHTLFDHYSPNAKTFEQVINKPTDSIISGISDITESLTKEWTMQMDLMYDIQYKLEVNHKNYLEDLKTYNDKKALIAKQREANPDERKKGVLKNPKQPREVEALPEGMYPDTYELFLKREHLQYQEFIDEFYHPTSLNLLPGEVNLRKYIILGGNYNLFYVSSPKHTDYKSFNITVHEKERKLIVLKDTVADLDIFENQNDDASSESGQLRQQQQMFDAMGFRSKTTLRSAKSTEAMLKDTLPISNMADLPYFFVTFNVPKHLCLWGAPIVCHYEESKSESTAELPILQTELLPKFDEDGFIISNETTRHADNGDPQPGASLIKRYTDIARKSSNIFRTQMAKLLRYSTYVPAANAPIIQIGNFSLNKTLKKNEAMNLQRICIPRIISSFKFPMEIKSDELSKRQSTSKSKNKMLTIFHKHDGSDDEFPTDDLPSEVLNFEFHLQDEPERVYPKFDSAEYVDFQYHNDNSHPTNTLETLTNHLDSVKMKYEKNCQKILSTEFSPKFKKKPTVTLDTQQSSVVFIPKTVPLKKTKLSGSTSMTKSVNIKQSGHSIEVIRESLQEQNSRSSFMKFSEADLADIDFISLKSLYKEKSEEFNEQNGQKIYSKTMHWTTSHIVNSRFNKTNLTITIQTDRLGIFGLAYNRYIHFPFRYWSLEPNEEKPGELIFTLDTTHVRVQLYISNKGYTGYVTDIPTTYTSKIVKYVEINEPVTDMKDLIQRFIEKNVNIFYLNDAGFYIDNGTFTQKHLATEFHIYESMSVHCFVMKFYHSRWNALSPRRDVILHLRVFTEKDESNAVIVRVRLDSSTFVEIKELCSDDIDIIKLEYTPTWRNIEPYADLHFLINSMCSFANDDQNKDPVLLMYVQKLLNAIRPLSFS